MSEVTCDTFWNGRLVFWQPAKGQGYRFNLDPVLLSGFVTPGEHVLELGAGCGILSMLLLKSGRCQQVTAVERQPALAHLLRRNVFANVEEHRMRVCEGDLRELSLPCVDRVVFNPPYFAAGHHRGAAHAGRDAARHERYGGLRDFVACARRHLEPLGRAAAIIPARRKDELLLLFQEAGLQITRVRDVLPRRGQAPGHALIEAAREQGCPTCELDPLIVHEEGGGAFAKEVRHLLAGA